MTTWLVYQINYWSYEVETLKLEDKLVLIVGKYLEGLTWVNYSFISPYK